MFFLKRTTYKSLNFQNLRVFKIMLTKIYILGKHITCFLKFWNTFFSTTYLSKKYKHVVFSFKRSTDYKIEGFQK